jgi:RNA polymerase-binding protein DksA
MASVTFDRELDEGLEEGAQQKLVQIDHAIAKLDDGTYGTCERCGRGIGEERLRARPWATLCIDDQRLADRG